MNELTSFMASLGHWNWWILALALLILELLAPGIYFLWLGCAALVTGSILIFIDPSWQWQMALFAGLSVISVIASRMLLNRPGMEDSDEPLLNKRAHQNIGKITTLADPITSGRGRIHIGGSYWNVTGPDLPAGTNVKVTGVQGGVLKVEPADS